MSDIGSGAGGDAPTLRARGAFARADSDLIETFNYTFWLRHNNCIHLVPPAAQAETSNAAPFRFD